MKQKKFLTCVLLLAVGGCTPPAKDPPGVPAPPPSPAGEGTTKNPPSPAAGPKLPPSSPLDWTPAPGPALEDPVPGPSQSLVPDSETAQSNQKKKEKKILLEIKKTLLKSVAGRPVDSVLNHATQAIDFLESFDWEVFYPPTFAAEYEKSITRPVRNKLRSHFERNELVSLKDPELLKPLEPFDLWCADCVMGWPPHPAFSDERSRFVTRSQEVYQALWELNPLNEQGVLARKCALRAFQMGNDSYQTDMENKLHRAEALYTAALSMQSIAAGRLAPVGPGRPVYEFCTGKDLLTGKPLSEEEVAYHLNPDLFNHPPPLGMISEERLKQERFFGYQSRWWNLEPPLFTVDQLVSFLKPIQVKPKTDKE